MAGAAMPSSETLHDAIHAEGFAFVEGDAMRPLIAQHGVLSDWETFADSWNTLELDRYMADGGRYRRRRHALFTVEATGAIERQPHQAHYQSITYNPLHGGIARWFAPMTAASGESPSLRAVLSTCHALFGRLAPATPRWHVEVHQFRIEARTGESGRPTPEGLHRDGVDYVLVLLVDRRNIASGTTSVHALDGEALGQFTLTRPFDAALVDDARVAHGVTPVEPMDPSVPAFRDVLVVTFVDERKRMRSDAGA